MSFPPLSTVVEIGLNFCGDKNGKKERMKENIGLKITMFGFFQAIYPAMIEM